jgi:hypothetical protein
MHLVLQALLILHMQPVLVVGIIKVGDGMHGEIAQGCMCQTCSLCVGARHQKKKQMAVAAWNVLPLRYGM